MIPNIQEKDVSICIYVSDNQWGNDPDMFKTILSSKPVGALKQNKTKHVF